MSFLWGKATEKMAEHTGEIKAYAKKYGYHYYIDKAHCFISTDVGLWCFNYIYEDGGQQNGKVILRHHNFIDHKINFAENGRWRKFSLYHYQDKPFATLNDVLHYIVAHDDSRRSEKQGWGTMPTGSKKAQKFRQSAKTRARHQSVVRTVNLLNALEEKKGGVKYEHGDRGLLPDRRKRKGKCS